MAIGGTPVGNMIIKVDLDSVGLEKSMTGLQRQLKSSNKAMGAQLSAFDRGGKSTSKYGVLIDGLSNRHKIQAKMVEEASLKYKTMAGEYGENSVKAQQAAQSLNEQIARYQETGRELDSLTAEFKEFQRVQELQNTGWYKVADGMEKWGGKLQTAGKKMTDFGKSYTMKVTAPIVAGGVAVFKASMDYESAFAGVRKTVDMSEEGYAKLSKGIRDMSKQLPASATDIAAVAESAGQLGIQNDSILSFIRTIIDLGEATNMTQEQAATEFARFANIVGMSQKDFDRLGSSVVGLGNTMATTESEIVSMAMRLAAQGKQVGMTEAQIMALAGTMSSLGVEAEAGGTAMTTVLKKIDKAVGEGGKSLNGFAKAAKVDSKEFAKAWNKDPIKALDMFIKGLGKSGDEGKNLTSILGDLGIKGIRETDTLLRMAGASDILSEAVDTSSTAWEENTALTDEAAERYKTTESQLKIMWNRVKDVAITLGSALVPAVMSTIDAVEPLIKKIESGAQAFADMDKEQQRTIIKMIGFAAAIGPVSMGLGGLTTAAGGFLKTAGSLTKTIGLSGGSGLVGRIGLMGLGATPVGLAVAGVGALAVGIYALNNMTSDSTRETLKMIEARKEELDTNDELIDSLEALKKKNKLTTDEFLRYMDIMTELKNAESEKAIKKLTDEQAGLLKKSGLTNDEMTEFLSLNSQIVEKAPETAKAISDQGNAYVDVLEEVKKLNKAERERLTDQTAESLNQELGKQRKNLSEQKNLTEEINVKERERNEELKMRRSTSEKLREQNAIIAGLEREILSATGDTRLELERNLRKEEEIRLELDGQLFQHDKAIDALEKQVGKRKDSLEETNKELKAFDQLVDEYGRMVLLEQGIVSEKGKAVEKVREEQNAIDVAKRKLEEFGKKNGRNTFEYQEQNKKLQEQQSKLDSAKKKMQDFNTEAGKTVFKKVEVKTSPTPATLNEYLSKSVSKNVNVHQRVSGPQAYAAGTTGHVGGMILVGGIV